MAYRPPLRRPGRPRPLRGAGGIVGVALLFCLVGVAGLGAYNLQAVYRASGPARDAADAFLRDVAAGDLPAAYNRLCPDTRDRLSRDAFAQRVRALPRIRTYEVRDVSVATNRAELKGTVTADVTWDTGVPEPRTLTMVTVDGDWRVCGDPF
jgi:Domain of unknown function (DUF4878)